MSIERWQRKHPDCTEKRYVCWSISVDRWSSREASRVTEYLKKLNGSTNSGHLRRSPRFYLDSQSRNGRRCDGMTVEERLLGEGIEWTTFVASYDRCCWTKNQNRNLEHSVADLFRWTWWACISKKAHEIKVHHLPMVIMSLALDARRSHSRKER